MRAYPNATAPVCIKPLRYCDSAVQRVDWGSIASELRSLCAWQIFDGGAAGHALPLHLHVDVAPPDLQSVWQVNPYG